MVLKMQRSASGIFEFNLEFLKPTGKKESSPLLPVMEALEYTGFGMLVVYIISELYQYFQIFR